MPELPKVSEVSSELQLPQEPQRKIWQHYMFWVLLVYGIGVLAMLGRLLYSFYKLWNIVRKGEITYFEGQKILLVEREISAFSFFNLIVLSHKDYEENPQEIITHEQMHSLYLHSVDALFVEFLLVVQWFNVGLWSLRNDLRALHEYEADRGVLRTGIDATRYQLLLVKKAVGERCFTSVANSFNHSLIKNYAFAQPAVEETMDSVQQDVVEVTEKPINNWAIKVWNYIVEFDRSEGKYIVLRLRHDNKESHIVLMNKANQVMLNGRKFPANFDKNMMVKKVSADFYRKWKELPQKEEYFVPQLFSLQKDSKTDIATVVRVTDALLQGYDEAVTKISQETGKDYEDITRLNPLLIVFQKPYILPPPPPKEYRKGKRDKKGNSFNDVTDIIEQKQEKQCHLISQGDVGKMFVAANFPIEILRELLKPERNSLVNVGSFNLYLGKSDTVKIETINEIKNLLRKNNRLKLRYEASSPKKNVFKIPSEKSDAWNTPQGLPIEKSAIKSTAKYGMRLHPILKVKKLHKGNDYAAAKGTPIVATANGTVITVKFDKKAYGNHIIIKHNDTFKTLYAHMQEINVKQGQTVKKGQVIGTVGSSGVSTTPHLHYEVRKNGLPVNPANYL
ncbi:MAG: hypothetical protein CSB01_02725 [Bacteroidia bacterium]|nr:MAG: hypothetical protein CSB01_02725 [Bacteroidia bacterium]